MKKIYQDKFGKGGNCQSAVHATMLGLGLDDVPYYNEGLSDLDISQDELDKIFNDRVADFLSTHGYVESWYHYNDPSIQDFLKQYPDTPYQVVGLSPRGYNHVVIYKNGKLYHDPHPDGGGVVETYVILLILKNSSEGVNDG